MGARFKLKHANIMGYLTSRSTTVPRVLRMDMLEFLEALSYAENNHYLISEFGFEHWPRRISKIAHKACEVLRTMSDSSFNTMSDFHTDAVQDVLSPSTAEKVLERLRFEFSGFPLYALAVGKRDQIHQKALELARRPNHGQLLVLIPEQDLIDRNFDVLDPTPVFSAALHAAPEWPGFAFWTPNGVSVFAPLNQLDELLLFIRSHTDDFFHYRCRAPLPHCRGCECLGSFDLALLEWSEGHPSRSRRLLHLSDLHFGTRDSLENQPHLAAQLHNVVKSVDRVVITGDLFHQPKEDYAALFRAFHNNITRLAAGREPISITGNHDQRAFGMFGNNYKQVAFIGASNVEVDDQASMIFLCFNSSIKGNLARGKITKSQLRRVGADFNTHINTRPEIKDYLPIVLVHHHPFSYDAHPETFIQKILAQVHLREESFLKMVDADDLHRWCMDWNIKTILHGHKHKARYVEQTVSHEDRRHILTAIGCGSSLGAEGTPVSYNVLEWDPIRQRWVASFFESVNGGAFREIAVSVSPENINR